MRLALPCLAALPCALCLVPCAFPRLKTLSFYLFSGSWGSRHRVSGLPRLKASTFYVFSGFLGLKALCLVPCVFTCFRSSSYSPTAQHIEFLRVFGVPKGPRPKAQAPKGSRVSDTIRYELGWPGVAWYGLGAWAAFTRNLVGTLVGPCSLSRYAWLLSALLYYYTIHFTLYTVRVGGYRR